MSWRRRLLGTSALIGVSVLCLRPVLTTGIERRLSEQLRLPVSLGDTRLAMAQNSVQLLAFSIDDEQCPLKIEELSLRLDGNALLYRDCIVESFVGSGLKWYLPKAPKIAQTSSEPIITGDESAALKEIHSRVSLAMNSLRDAESTSMERSRTIDLKLEAIKARIDEAIYGNPAPNPLRNSNIAEKLRSDLIAIQSLLASDRVEASKSDVANARALEELAAGLELAKSKAPTSTVSAELVGDAMLTSSIQLVTSRIQPYTIAAETGYQRFLKQMSGEGYEVAEFGENSPQFRAGRDLMTDRIPTREFAIRRGKITGLSCIGERNLSTEVLISSTRLKRQDSNVLQIVWKETNESGAATNCRMGANLGGDNSLSHTLNLTHRDSNLDVGVQIEYQPTHRNILLTFPIHKVLEQLDGIEQDVLQATKRICEERAISLSARSKCPLTSAVLAQDCEWTIDEDSKNFSSAISDAIDQCLALHREAWLHKTQAEYSSARNLLESRKLALDEARNHRSTLWADAIKSMEIKLDSIDNAARSALSRDSNIVR